MEEGNDCNGSIKRDCCKSVKSESCLVIEDQQGVGIQSINAIAHSRNLALYFELGMKLAKIPRALESWTSTFLEEYIAFRTYKRKEARSEYCKPIFRTFSNSFYSGRRTV